MKPIALCFAMGLALAAACSGGSAGMTAEELKKLPGLNQMTWMRVPPARKTPTIDGTLNLDGGEWADAVCVAGMMGWRAQGGMLMPIPCRTYITWDERNFYVGLRTGILPGGRLRRRERHHEGQPHRDDAIELFFDPLTRDQAERAHYQAIFNSLGFTLDFMICAGVNAKFWNGGWTIRSDYQAGMDHWDSEVAVPVASMHIQSPNASGQTWRFLACRDWVRLQDAATGKKFWRIYSSLTGWGAFPYPESYGGLVLDDSAPAAQLLDLDPLWSGKFGFAARIANPTDRPIACVASAKVFHQYREGSDRVGNHVDWSQRPDPLHEVTRDGTLEPGKEIVWTVPPTDLPPLPAGKDAPQWYDMVFTVTSRDGKTCYLRAQRHFRTLRYETYVQPYELPLTVTYNPIRDNVRVWCDVLDDPHRERARGVAVAIYEPGQAPGQDKPLVEAKVTTLRHGLFEGIVAVPPLRKVGEYPVRATLFDAAGKPLATRDLAIEKLDEAKEFKWWRCRAGILGRPIPPHVPMRCAAPSAVGKLFGSGKPVVVATTMGECTFDGSALPVQVRMTGEDLLASPVRVTCAAGGKPLALERRAAPRVPKRSDIEVDLTGRLSSQALEVRVANHMEYDGCMRVTLDVEPKGEPTIDHLRLEIPFKPDRGQWLWSMAQDCRASWLAVDLRKGQGVVWDSSDRTGFQMAVGTFMPQYVVSDSLRGLCWFADNDRGWVPRDDVPAAEVVRTADATVLRLNLVGKPFTLRGARRVVFHLLGLPARPLPKGWRLYHRSASNFGHYVGDPVVNYSAPMPRDFKKAQEFMTDGALFNKDGSRKPQRSGKCHPWFEFAPWHDTHTWFRTPEINRKTFSYFALECGDGSFSPTTLDYKCSLWNEYVRQTDIAGVYFDTPESMGFSFNLSNGVAYTIPDGQPGAGKVQPGYTIAGFREYVKRVRGIFATHGRDHPWIEMHSTHGPVAPCTPFLDIRTDGEHYRTPNSRHFMHAWKPSHFRAIDVPPLYGIVTRWLGGYPWDGSVPDADPQRCKIGALVVHDLFTGWGDFNQRRGVYHNQGPTNRGPLLGYRHPAVSQKLIACGMNRDEVVFHPYWSNGRLLKVTAAGGEVRASLWHIPSQRKAIVAVASYAGRPTRGIRVEPDLAALGLAPQEAGERLLVLDAEMGEALPSPPVVDLPPLDFRLLLFARVAVSAASPAAKLSIEPAKDREGKPIVPADCIRNELTAHGFFGPDVKQLPAPGLVTAPEGLRCQVLHVASQSKALVALTSESAKGVRGASLAVSLDKLGLRPERTGENLLVFDARTGAVLQETTHISRGRIHLRPTHNAELGRVRIDVPAGQTALLLLVKQ